MIDADILKAAYQRCTELHQAQEREALARGEDEMSPDPQDRVLADLGVEPDALADELRSAMNGLVAYYHEKGVTAVDMREVAFIAMLDGFQVGVIAARMELAK